MLFRCFLQICKFHFMFTSLILSGGVKNKTKQNKKRFITQTMTEDVIYQDCLVNIYFEWVDVDDVVEEFVNVDDDEDEDDDVVVTDDDDEFVAAYDDVYYQLVVIEYYYYYWYYYYYLFEIEVLVVVFVFVMVV